MISLLEHLYAKFLKEKIAPAPPNTYPEEGIGMFVKWAQEYLNEKRPAAISHKCELNYAVTLQDGQEVLISPEYRQPVRTGGEEHYAKGGVVDNQVRRQFKPGDMAGGSPTISLTPENIRRQERGLDDGTSVQL